MPFDPPAFNPAKLSVAYEPGVAPLAPPPLGTRRYTLTHNDLTGALQLTIGRQFNRPQLSGVFDEPFSCFSLDRFHEYALLLRSTPFGQLLAENLMQIFAYRPECSARQRRHESTTPQPCICSRTAPSNRGRSQN